MKRRNNYRENASHSLHSTISVPNYSFDSTSHYDAVVLIRILCNDKGTLHGTYFLSFILNRIHSAVSGGGTAIGPAVPFLY